MCQITASTCRKEQNGGVQKRSRREMHFVAFVKDWLCGKICNGFRLILLQGIKLVLQCYGGCEITSALPPFLFFGIWNACGATLWDLLTFHQFVFQLFLHLLYISLLIFLIKRAESRTTTKKMIFFDDTWSAPSFHLPLSYSFFVANHYPFSLVNN